MLDRETLEAYQRRWKAAAERQAREQEFATVAQRWAAVNALLGMAAALGVRLQRNDHEDEIVRQRWNRLRDLYLSGRGRESQ